MTDFKHELALVETTRIGARTRIWAFTPQGLIDFKGNYEEFFAKYGDAQAKKK